MYRLALMLGALATVSCSNSPTPASLADGSVDASVDAGPCVVPPQANTYDAASSSGCMPIPGPDKGEYELRCYEDESADGAITSFPSPAASLGCIPAGTSGASGYQNYACPCAQ
jgi:hypothetical protein